VTIPGCSAMQRNHWPPSLTTVVPASTPRITAIRYVPEACNIIVSAVRGRVRGKHR
jgi:hypothetical protein